jgi:hypothetical protein
MDKCTEPRTEDDYEALKADLRKSIDSLEPIISQLKKKAEYFKSKYGCLKFYDEKEKEIITGLEHAVDDIRGSIRALGHGMASAQIKLNEKHVQSEQKKEGEKKKKRS